MSQNRKNGKRSEKYDAIGRELLSEFLSSPDDLYNEILRPFAAKKLSELAKDALQTALYKAQTGPVKATVNDVPALYRWLRRTVQNDVLDQLRRRSREQSHQEGVGRRMAALHEERDAGQQLPEFLERVLGRVSPKARETLELSRVQGLTLAEMAERRGTSIATQCRLVEAALAEAKLALENEAQVH